MTKSGSGTRALEEAIKEDHEFIRQCYANHKSATSEMDKKRWANEFIRQVSIHSVAEEIAVYPVMQDRLDGGIKIANHSRDEHQVVKNELYELDKMSLNKDPDGYRSPKISKLLTSSDIS
eukprot:Partr_v1_DN24270_c0_g1_i1_m36888 putative domain protein